jgi:hypothetical protein
MEVLGADARWILRSEDVGPEVVDLSFFPDFVIGCSGSWSKIAQVCPPVDVPQ